jgi:hypothetical protein
MTYLGLRHAPIAMPTPSSALGTASPSSTSDRWLPHPGENHRVAKPQETMEVSSESHRERLRWFQRAHALELFREHRLRIPPDARPTPAHPDHPRGEAQPSNDGDGAIVEYLNDRDLWEPVRVSWETHRALTRA